MFNIGAGEIIVIALVLLVAVGPEQLPGLIRRIGRTVAEVRAMADSLRSEFMDSMDEMERAVDPKSWAQADEATTASGVDDPVRADDIDVIEQPDPFEPAPHRPARVGPADETDGTDPVSSDSDNGATDPGAGDEPVVDELDEPDEPEPVDSDAGGDSENGATDPAAGDEPVVDEPVVQEPDPEAQTTPEEQS